MKKSAFFAFVALLISMLAGCGSTNEQTEICNSTPIWHDCIIKNYESGRIVGKDPAFYIDYDTMKKTVLCSRPNCTHTTSECIGKIIGDTPIITDSGIYFFNTVEGINELNDGTREHYINSKFCRVLLDTSEIETIVEFHDCAPREYDGCVLYDNVLYFAADDLNPTLDDYGNIITSNVGGTHYICSIDITTGEYKNYGSVYNGENYNLSSHASICGYFADKILINYEYAAFPNCTDMNKPWNGLCELMFEFDPVTKQITPSDIPTRPIWTDTLNQTVLYYDEILQKTILLTPNDKKEIDIIVGAKAGSLATVHNNKLFVRDTGSWYDLEDMSEHCMGKYSDYHVIDYYDNCYIMVQHLSTVKLTEEELLALDKE